jgi:cobalamin-dependent methionine synthase I
MLIIGERINASRNSIAEAISSEDAALIQGEVQMQAAAGAHYIDVNAGTFIGRELEKLKWLVHTVQQATDLPLCIDSPDPKVIEAVLPLLKTAPMINSITLEPSRLNAILPLVTRYKAKVIALCQAEDAMAETAESKLRMSGQLVEKATGAGVPMDDIYIDPLVYPLSTNAASAQATLDAIEPIVKRYPGVHTICGLTNVSYGLPNRRLINRTFLAAAIARGLDSAILDPTDKQLYASLKAALMVVGKDEFCMGYITAYREGRLE